MASLQFELTGFKRARKLIKQQGRKIKNPKKVLKQVAQQEINDARTRIQFSKRDPEGRPWAPWSMATLRQRLREGNVGRGLLYRTGTLLRSFAYRLSGNTVRFGNTARYAEFLQRGTTKMPARSFLTISNKTKQRIIEYFKRGK